ncbi:sigma-70 family RNA polymerase sigma factor [Gemmata sp. JC673]|uniref:Sigma-70 family RNA polymerase sigma factor n=1 Tax=Gemmata algarum TaxID=2975278 RepID=A0ABU5F8D1_9BACT|nr:sigma-70 family RNA polymerase sigma factor [Gemmata algarum]MDY3563838.1 sigma-70 family RNA polymerase sigma factor [Gemmata algarum]
MTVPNRAVPPRLLNLLTADPVPDADLLSRFIQSRDGAAFAALVERHGPMVLRVCRRTLWDAHTAEDAFQATFLALVRGASRVRKTASVAAWLHGAAVRISLKARGAATRAHRTPPSPARCGPDPLAEITGRELVSAIDEELARLPDRFRAAITLCCLEGLSQDEAARRLGWSAASVRGRLERGRERLRLRLARRGLALSAGLSGLLPGEAHATVPPQLLARAVELAARGPVPPRVAEMAAGAAPSGATWKAVAVALVVLAVGGAAAIGSGSPPQNAPETATAPTMSLAPSGARPEGGARRPAADPPVKTDRYGDPLPAGAIMRLGTLRTRAPITGFGIEKDGTVVTVGPGADVRRWHAADDRSDEPAALPLTGPAARHHHPQVSPDGKLVAACSSDKVFVWEAPAGAKANPKQVAAFDLARAGLFRFAPDGRTLAVVTEAWNMVPAGAFLCDLKTQTAAAIDTGGVSYFEDLGFSGDGKRLGAVADASFILWDATTGKQLTKYQTSGRMSAVFALNHTGDTLAATYDYIGKTELRFTDPETGKKKDGLTGPGGSIRWLTYATDGKTLLAGDLGGVRWWDPVAGKLVRTCEGVAAEVFALERGMGQFTPDGKVLVSHNGHALLRWNAETGKPLFPEQDIGHGATVTAVGVSPDGTRIATRGMDNRLCVWNAASGKRLWHAPADSSSMPDIDFGPDGTFLVVCGPGWGKATKYDAATGKVLLTFAVDPKGPKQSSVSSARVSKDGKTVVAYTDPYTLGDPRVVTTWNAATGERLKSIQLANRGPTDFGQLSRDGQYLAGGLMGGPVVAVAAPDRNLLADAKPAAAVKAGRFSADGQWLVQVTFEFAGGVLKHSAVLVSTTTWRAVSTIPLTADYRARISVAPDGRTLAVALGDAVEFYDAVTQKLLGRHRIPPGPRGKWESSHFGTISALSFTPDGTKLITGHADTTALVWPVPARPEK